jgi:hypothetical protein
MRVARPVTAAATLRRESAPPTKDSFSTRQTVSAGVTGLAARGRL